VGNNAEPKFGLWHPEPNSLLETLVVNEHNFELQRFHLGNSSDDDFIEASLGGVDYSYRLYKKTIPNCKFIKVQFQIKILKK
jgi:hypothetical protein